MATRQSPVQHLLKAYGGEWTLVDGTPLAIRFDDTGQEVEAARELGLCDVSSLPKIGVKGGAASQWLRSQGVDVPADIYDTRKLGDGGWTVRTASDEFLLESGLPCEWVPALARELGPGREGMIRVERQEATLLLTGKRAVDVFAQTCGVEMGQLPKSRLIMTRVAGVSCGILPWQREEMSVYQIWVDNSYAIYMWETLHEITQELGGCVLGAAAVLDGLSNG